MKQNFELYPAAQPLNISVTPRMIQTLKKCYKIELEFPGKPYGPKDLKESFNGLYERGLLDIDMSNRKLKTGRWYITLQGLQFLVALSTKRMAPNDPFLKNNINKLKNNIQKLQDSIHKLKVTSGRIPESN